MEWGRLGFVRIRQSRKGALQSPVQQSIVEQLYAAGDLRHFRGKGIANGNAL
jgi:hypothetical protein